MDKKRWYVDGRQVPFREYRKALRCAYKHSLKIFMYIYRIDELSLSVMDTVLKRDFLTPFASVRKGVVYVGGKQMCLSKDVASRLVKMQDAFSSPTYYDYRGKLIEE